MGMPVLSPGPTTLAVVPKYEQQTSSMTGVKGGTTLEMMAPVSLPAETPETCIRLRSRAPYSSAVLSVSVSIFQLLTSLRPRKRPMAMVVLPTSNAKSIRTSSAGRVELENGVEDLGPGAGAPDDEPPFGIEPLVGGLERAGGRLDHHRLPRGEGRPRSERRDARLLVSPGEDII